ncbi:hypothetical protein FE257_007148 [Aspergillus nanangensis]|uniref:FAD-binding domain-containing protein n=1 Tax=Aspergillus nanangensis TaxID=2582783 RepID=A0AAD4CN76_ASPNN|nr:hypothetical protein FE257_007148 [Aspergillus nanangensis]
MPLRKDCDVLIVGAGPIGLTCALLLRDLGHEVHVLERHAEHYKQPRAVGIYHQGVRAFEALGLLEELFRTQAFQDIRGHVSDFMEIVGADGEILSRHQFNSTESRSGRQMSFAMHQPTLESVLEEACGNRGVHIRRGIEVTGVSDRGDDVEVDISRTFRAEGKLESAGTVTASFVIGCDGANSIVRKSAGIEFHPLQGADSRWLVVDVIPQPPGPRSPWKDASVGRQYLNNGRSRTSVPSSLTRRRWEWMVHPSESTESAMDESFIWGLLEEFDCNPNNATMERSTVYPLKGGWANDFVKGRIALAGDAAHLAPQFLGQGLNSGLRDAKALCWRLDFALKHPQSNWPKALQDYSNEQLGTTKTFVMAAVGLEKLFTVTDPVQARARDEMLKMAGRPPPNLERLGAPGMYVASSGQDEYPPADEPGSLFIQGWVEFEGKEGLFDVVVGTGWMLLGRGPDEAIAPLSPELVQKYFTILNGRSVTFGNQRCKDVTGRYSEWFKTNDAVAVLVRPDYYIFGVAKSADEIGGLVNRAVDHLS